MKNGREILTEFLKSMMHHLDIKGCTKAKILQIQINGLILTKCILLMDSLIKMTEISLKHLELAKLVTLAAF